MKIHPLRHVVSFHPSVSSFFLSVPSRVHNKEESVQLPYTLSKMSPLSTVALSKNVLNVIINTLVLLTDIIVGVCLYNHWRLLYCRCPPLSNESTRWCQSLEQRRKLPKERQKVSKLRDRLREKIRGNYQKIIVNYRHPRQRNERLERVKP